MREAEQARVSNYTQVLADFEQKKVYLLKEMYLLQGNVNGTYGYVREIKSEDQCLCVYDVLDLKWIRVWIILMAILRIMNAKMNFCRMLTSRSV